MAINRENVRELFNVNGNIVVSSYHSGVGKTYAGCNFQNVIDLESSDFQWIYLEGTNNNETRKGKSAGRVKNKLFPLNYTNRVLELLATRVNSIIVISSHKEIVELLEIVGTKILATYPAEELRNILYKRCIDRGNCKEFADKAIQTFDIHKEYCLKQKYTVELTLDCSTISELFNRLGINLVSMEGQL